MVPINVILANLGVKDFSLAPEPRCMTVTMVNGAVVTTGPKPFHCNVNAADLSC